VSTGVEKPGDRTKGIPEKEEGSWGRPHTEQGEDDCYYQNRERPSSSGATPNFKKKGPGDQMKTGGKSRNGRYASYSNSNGNSAPKANPAYRKTWPHVYCGGKEGQRG